MEYPAWQAVSFFCSPNEAIYFGKFIPKKICLKELEVTCFQHGNVKIDDKNQIDLIRAK